MLNEVQYPGPVIHYPGGNAALLPEYTVSTTYFTHNTKLDVELGFPDYKKSAAKKTMRKSRLTMILLMNEPRVLECAIARENRRACVIKILYSI